MYIHPYIHSHIAAFMHTYIHMYILYVCMYAYMYVPYIANCLRWKSFAVFMDPLVTMKLFW